ncbi:hypothetical protein BC940DRAFT_293575 [Gongronella butleri]|nr:hypothetical protein BC940DRAFT_293575 [Gongronella butleri]
MGVFLYLCLLLLLQASSICGALFTTSNTYISTSFVTLYSNTSDIDTPAANGSHTQTNDRNIIQCNEVTPPNSGLQGVLYDRGTSCQQDTTDIIPALLTNQPKIALVKASGDCNLTQKAYYSALDGAIAVVAFGPFDQGVYTDTTISVQDSINITVYYVDVNVGYSILQQLRQTQPIGYDAANNVTYQTAMKITLFPAIGGFPNAWEFTLLIVVALLLVSFLISGKLFCTVSK